MDIICSNIKEKKKEDDTCKNERFFEVTIDKPII